MSTGRNINKIVSFLPLLQSRSRTHMQIRSLARLRHYSNWETTRWKSVTILIQIINAKWARNVISSRVLFSLRISAENWRKNNTLRVNTIVTRPCKELSGFRYKSLNVSEYRPYSGNKREPVFQTVMRLDENEIIKWKERRRRRRRKKENSTFLRYYRTRGNLRRCTTNVRDM